MNGWQCCPFIALYQNTIHWVFSSEAAASWPPRLNYYDLVASQFINLEESGSCESTVCVFLLLFLLSRQVSAVKQTVTMIVGFLLEQWGKSWKAFQTFVKLKWNVKVTLKLRGNKTLTCLLLEAKKVRAGGTVHWGTDLPAPHPSALSAIHTSLCIASVPYALSE